MPKKTLSLVVGLVLITLILFAIALNNSQKAPPPAPPGYESSNQIPAAMSESDQTPAHSVLSLSPQPVVVAPGQKGTVQVRIDPSDNEVTAVQLEIAYDPNFITNVQITPGELFTNPVVIINKNILKEGRYTYAFGIMPNHPVVTAAGNTATITFTALNKPGQNSQLALLPTTLVTARGISNSVLKSATGTLIQITQP